MGTSRKPHAVMLGLDGMPLQIFDTLFERGVMPFLRSLWNRSIRGELNVLIPYTMPSWTTISTGVNPGKHGVFDFLEVDETGTLRVVTKERLEYPLVNEIVAYNRRRAVSINVLMNYPPLVRTNNVVVSSWAASKEPRAWPPEELSTVRKFMSRDFPTALTLEEKIENLVEVLESRIGLIEYYYMNSDWDLFYTILPEPDWLFHSAYGLYVRGSKRARKADRIFQLIDKLVRFIYENKPENTLIVMCSDHGFSEAREALNGNVLLEKMGLLKRNKNMSLKGKLALMAARLLPSGLRASLKQSVIVKRLLRTHLKELSIMGSQINYRESKAYMLSSYTLYLNPRVEGEERAALLSRITKALSKYDYMLEVVEDGKRYFKGPYVDRAPDLVLIPKPGYHITATLAHRDVVERARMDVHSSRGFFAILGDPVDAGGVLERPLVSTVLVPTVLAHLGLPLDPYMDGKPLLPIRNKKKANYRLIVSLARRLHGRGPAGGV